MHDPIMDARRLAEDAASLSLTGQGKLINKLFAQAKMLVGDEQAQNFFADAFANHALQIHSFRFRHRVPCPVDRVYKVLRRHVPASLANPAFTQAGLKVTRMHHIPQPRPKWRPSRGMAATGVV